MKPCIIFFDEFDAIVPKRYIIFNILYTYIFFYFRNSGSTGVTDRVVN